MAITDLPPPILLNPLQKPIERAAEPIPALGALEAATHDAIDENWRRTGGRGPILIQVAAAAPVADAVIDAPTAPAHVVRGGDLERTWRGFRDITAEQLAAVLPARAQPLAAAFIDSARAHDLDPLLLVAISRHETASWTSRAFKHNNAMGVAGRHGTKRFKTVGASIELMAKTLSDPEGPYKDAKTIRDLWKIYAPSPKVGTKASNDPHGLNRSWGTSVARNIAEYELELGAAARRAIEP